MTRAIGVFVGENSVEGALFREEFHIQSLTILSISYLYIARDFLLRTLHFVSLLSVIASLTIIVDECAGTIKQEIPRIRYFRLGLVLGTGKINRILLSNS